MIRQSSLDPEAALPTRGSKLDGYGGLVERADLLVRPNCPACRVDVHPTRLELMTRQRAAGDAIA